MVHEGGPSPEMPRDREDDFQVVRVPVHPPHLVQRSHAPRYKSRSASVCSVQNEGSRVGTVPVSVNFGKNEFRHVLPLLKLEKKKTCLCRARPHCPKPGQGPLPGKMAMGNGELFCTV